MTIQKESNTITKNTGIINQEEISSYLKDIRKLKEIGEKDGNNRKA